LIRRRSPRHRRYYQSLNSDLVGVVRAQGGYITGYGGQKVPQSRTQREEAWREEAVQKQHIAIFVNV
jgi:hypothetical protein